MLYKIKNMGCDEKILCSLYYSLFESHLSFGLVAWGSSTYAKVLIYLSVYYTKRALRAIFGLSYNDSTVDSFKNFKILTLEKLYNLNWLLLCGILTMALFAPSLRLYFN